MLKCVDGEAAHFHIASKLTDYGHQEDSAATATTETHDLDYRSLLELREIISGLLGVQ
jgi:hypothetical protein